VSERSVSRLQRRRARGHPDGQARGPRTARRTPRGRTVASTAPSYSPSTGAGPPTAARSTRSAHHSICSRTTVSACRHWAAASLFKATSPESAVFFIADWNGVIASSRASHFVRRPPNGEGNADSGVLVLVIHGTRRGLRRLGAIVAGGLLIGPSVNSTVAVGIRRAGAAGALGECRRSIDQGPSSALAGSCLGSRRS
jgi:hypothetical protein